MSDFEFFLIGVYTLLFGMGAALLFVVWRGPSE